MAAEHIQKTDTVQCDPLIISGNYIDTNKDQSGVSIGELGDSIKNLSNDAEPKDSVETDVNSGLVNHAESSTNLVDLESSANVIKTESKMPSYVSSNLQLQMEWSDTEEDTGQSILGDCGKKSLEADGADDTSESRNEAVERTSGAEATLQLKVEPPELQDEPTASEEVSKELPDEEPAALEVKGGGEEDEKGKVGAEKAAGGGQVEVEEEVVVVKQRKTRLECRECGKCFTRRETYNLHRHFHMHQDEQASLTCKECGLTFQHRSSLIKHRNEHKEKEKEKEKAESAPTVPASATAALDKKALFKTANPQNDPQCEYCGKTFDTLVRLRTHNCKLAPEKPYRCPLCRKEFQYRVSITSHMQTHSLEYPFRCLECNKGFQSAMTLRIHQRSHAALKPFACPECGMVFRHRSVMEDHRRRHTEERPYHCNLCGKYFKYASLLHQHQYLHTGKKPFRCRDCGKAFAFSQNLRAHMRQHQKHPHSCPHCLDTFSDEAKLQEHVATHEMSAVVDKENANYALDQPRLYNCPLCSQVYYRPADLRVHMLVHEAEFEGMSNGVREVERTYACSRCPLTFSDEASLQSHAITHEASFMRRDVRGLGMGRRESMPGSGIYGDQIDKKPLKCRDCGRGFRHRSVLELHMRIHSKDKPYRCNECGKSFRFGSYLQQHLIIHTGKKPYKCPDCGKDFAFLQNMKTHQRLHQQKPFRCTQCRKGYSDEDQLQRHMLSHTGDKPHKCHLCHKSFGLAYLLRDHMNTHTGERPHRCQECNKSFQWLSSLLVHQKIHMRKHQDGKRGRRVNTYRSDWQRWDRTPGTMLPNTYAASASQVPNWQGRITQQQQQQQGFVHQSDSQELPKQQSQQEPWQPSAPVTHQSQWKPEQKQEPQRQPELTAKTVQAQQQQQQQQWQMERQTQPAQMLAQNATWISVMAPQTNQAVQQQAQQKLLQQQQQAPAEALSGKTDSALTSQAAGVFSKPHSQPEDGPLAWGNKTSPVVSHILNPLKAAEHERSPLSVFWGSTSSSVQPQTSTGTVAFESGSIISPTKPNDQEPKLLQPQLPKASTSIQTTQPGVPSLPSKDDTNLWSYKIPIGVPLTIQDQLSSGSDKQQRQQTPSSLNQSSATNQTAIIDPSRIPPGTENTHWTFQATSGIPKPLGTQDSSTVEQLQQQLQQPPQLMHLQQQKLQLQQQQQQQLQLQQQLQQQQQQLQLQQQQLQLQQQLQQQQQQQQLQLHQQQHQQQQQQQLQLQQQQQIQLQQQQKQTSIASTWVNPPTSSQMNPITIQYGPPRFPHSEAPAVWGFQTSPPGSQTLLTGPIQQGAVRAQTQLPLMTGPQIIINQTPPFLSPALRPLPPLGLPAPHPLHSVAVNQIPRPPPQNLFFNPQGILGDGPPLSQTRPFSQLTPRTELPNLTGRLPFSTDRRQCVVCGCSFSQELELQMHYMQHAKGEI